MGGKPYTDKKKLNKLLEVHHQNIYCNGLALVDVVSGIKPNPNRRLPDRSHPRQHRIVPDLRDISDSLHLITLQHSSGDRALDHFFEILGAGR